jgi:predicted PurR-regulated permease PerM
MKIVAGMAIIAIVGALMFYLRPIIGPLLLAAILTYLLYPLVDRFSRLTRLPWLVSSNIVFLVFIILLLSFIAVVGFALVQQIQNLIELISGFLKNLPQWVAGMSDKTLTVGFFQFNLGHLDANTLAKQILDNIQPTLGQTGNVVGSVATGTAAFIGWLVFVLLVTYFILTEAHRSSDDTMPYLDFPGYNYDIYRLGRELNRTWNAFLRGQIIVVMIASLLFLILYTVLGVRYSLVLAFMAGFARFIPYLGQWSVMLTTAVISSFQGGNYFGMHQDYYVIMVLVCVALMDTTIDQLITPRILGSALGLHPAAIIVTALLSTQLIGFVGLILAAPVLASIMLIGRYIGRKMLNQDPWTEPDIDTPPVEFPWMKIINRLTTQFRK